MVDKLICGVIYKRLIAVTIIKYMYLSEIIVSVFRMLININSQMLYEMGKWIDTNVEVDRHAEELVQITQTQFVCNETCNTDMAGCAKCD